MGGPRVIGLASPALTIRRRAFVQLRSRCQQTLQFRRRLVPDLADAEAVVFQDRAPFQVHHLLVGEGPQFVGDGAVADGPFDEGHVHLHGVRSAAGTAPWRKRSSQDVDWTGGPELQPTSVANSSPSNSPRPWRMARLPCLRARSLDWSSSDSDHGQSGQEQPGSPRVQRAVKK